MSVRDWPSCAPTEEVRVSRVVHFENQGGTAAELSPALQRDLFGCPPPSRVQASPEHGQFSSLHQMAAAANCVEHPDLLSQRILSWACPDAGHAPYEVVPCCAEFHHRDVGWTVFGRRRLVL
jgi:hypothetical protein